MTYFIKEIIKLDIRKGNLGKINITNIVEDTKKSTKHLLGKLLAYNDIIDVLTAQLKAQEALPPPTYIPPPFPLSGGIPSMVSTNTSTVVIMQQNQVMQVEINSLKAAAVTQISTAASTAAAVAAKFTHHHPNKKIEKEEMIYMTVNALFVSTPMIIIIITCIVWL